MLIIVGLVLAAGVLWLWLIANWFGRVLAFLLFGPLLGFLCGALASAALDRAGVPIGGGGSVMMTAGIGLGIGWCIASIPMWMRLRADRAYSRVWLGESVPSPASHSGQLICLPETQKDRP